MKAVRFIAFFSFLLALNFLVVSAGFAQETKIVDTQKIDKPVETKPVTGVNSVPQPVQMLKPNYRIGLYDVIEVQVAKHDKLSRGYVRLDEMGRFTMPRIEGTISALCKTEAELAKEISEIYRKTVLVDPYVSVIVKEQNSTPISVIGAVKNPGRILTTRPLTLLEILTAAGGHDVEFAGNKVQVARVGDPSGCASLINPNAKEEEITFYSYNLPDILRGKTNPVMRPGDIVSVLDADEVFVYGNVNKEGRVKIREEITLMQAIVSAEGLKPASKSKVRILRQKPGSTEREELIFDLKDIEKRKGVDPVLMPNDIVAVSEDPIKNITQSIGRALTQGVGGLFYRIP